MQKATEYLTTAPEGAHDLEAAAERASAWAGEPFLSEGEDAGVVLAPATSRRRALDDALAAYSRRQRRYGRVPGEALAASTG